MIISFYNFSGIFYFLSHNAQFLMLVAAIKNSPRALTKAKRLPAVALLGNAC